MNVFSDNTDQVQTTGGQYPPRSPKNDIRRWEIGRLLFCTDFSNNAEMAKEAVIRVWRSTGAKITVLHVCEYGPLPAFSDEDERYVDNLYAVQNQRLRAVVEELRGIGMEVDSKLLDGSPAVAILETIQYAQADLVVLATRATRGVERFVFGATAESVFRQAVCPVLTVGVVCGHLSERLLGPVVVATDFHDGAEESIRFAALVANAFHAELHCVHVLPAGSEEEGDKVIELIMREALRRLLAGAGPYDCEPLEAVLYGSDVAHSLTEYAKRMNAQAIILGVRRSRIASHLPAQRTYRLITTAPCPVITVPCKQETAISPIAVRV